MTVANSCAKANNRTHNLPIHNLRDRAESLAEVKQMT